MTSIGLLVVDDASAEWLIVHGLDTIKANSMVWPQLTSSEKAGTW